MNNDKEMDDLSKPPEDAEREELLASGQAQTNERLPQIMSTNNDKQRASSTDPDEESDPISECIGNYGKWQFKMTFLLSLCSFPCTFHIFSPNFLSAQRDFWCARPSNFYDVNITKWIKASQSDDRCEIANVNSWNLTKIENGETYLDHDMIPCTSWEFDRSEIGKTIIEEWNLVCDRAYLVTVAEVLFLLGVAIGGVVSGLISDKYGRKRTLVISLIIQTVVGITLSFCPWYELYLLLRIILGFVSVSVVFSAFVLIVELVGGKWRAVCGVCNFFPLPVSYIIVASLSLVLPDWRNLQITISIPGAFLIILWWVAPESPRWLMSMNRIVEVKRILKKAAKYNNKPLPESIDKILQPSGASTSDVEEANLVDLVRGEIRKITICVFVMWFALTMVYYGLVLNVDAFGASLHVNSILSGLVELPAIALSIPIIMKMGRVKPLCLTLFLSAVGCLAAAVVQSTTDMDWLKLTLLLIGKFSVSITNAAMPTFTAELYPTIMRNMGVGSSQFSAGIALVSIPYLWEFANKFMGALALIITGGFGILGGLCVLLLPETANRSLSSIKKSGQSNAGNSKQNGPKKTQSI